MGAHFHHWRLGFKQSSLGRIARVSRHAALDASRRPPLPWHALVPSRFRVQVSQVTQERSSKFLLTASGMQRSASRRTPCMRLSPHTAPQSPYPCHGRSRTTGSLGSGGSWLSASSHATCVAGHHPSSPSGRMRSSIHAVVSPLVTACYPYWSRAPSGDRPHVSLSWALPQAFASWGILRRVACGGHLLRRSTSSESTPVVTSFLLIVSWSGRATLSTGFCGGEHWSLCATPAPTACPVLGRPLSPRGPVRA